ncbi:biliverdin-producing heme oxygenase [Planktothrix agardhii]|nr:biliverdin-producing heme oxygenase [Planktothrix agardhii]MEA5562451.1 biliverdin-producing heme oxygenase [Planktothrix agardhii UHCC 0887]
MSPVFSLRKNLILFIHKTHPNISKIYFPELNRKANLEKDLNFYYGEHWPDNITASPAAQAYVSRLRELSLEILPFYLIPILQPNINKDYPRRFNC